MLSGLFQEKGNSYRMMNIVNSGSRYQVYGEDVKTYRDIDLMKLNFKCTKKYLISKGYSNDFIKNVKHLCNKHVKTLKSKKLIEDTIEDIMKKIETFSRAERQYVLDQVDVRFWNERR